MFLFATALFLMGSMLSGLSHSMPQLILFRALQGLGAGGVLPVTLTTIGDLYSLEERARVQVVFTSMWGTASLAGPVIGAFLTEYLSWRWVFYVNVPFGLVSALLIGVFLRENHQRRGRVVIDYAGAGLLTIAVVALLTAFVQAGGGESGRLVMIGCLVVAVAFIGAFVQQERRAEDPMLPLSLFGTQ